MPYEQSSDADDKENPTADAIGFRTVETGERYED
jgi:hypothetical protein